jgi:periplasmic divalent cation tolerance protein
VTGPHVVLVTAPTQDDALTLGRTLVDERLAACVNVLPGLTSIYRWEGRREEAAECLLVIKTDGARYPALERRVHELHSYTVPEVLALAVDAGAPTYVQWLNESVTLEGR